MFKMPPPGGIFFGLKKNLSETLNSFIEKRRIVAILNSFFGMFIIYW